MYSLWMRFYYKLFIAVIDADEYAKQPGQCTCGHCVHACHCHAVTCCCPATRPETDFRPGRVERKKEKKRRKSQKEERIFVGFSLTSQCAHALTNLTDRLGFNRAAADISLSDVFNLVRLICLHWCFY